MKRNFKAAVAAILFSALCMIAMTCPAFATETETVTETESLEQLLTVEQERNVMITLIEKAAPGEVAKIRAALDDALLNAETEGYGGWDWVYKMVSENVDAVAYIIAGIGLLINFVFAVVKLSREKKLTNNAVDAVETAKDIAEKNTGVIESYAENNAATVQAVQGLMARLLVSDTERNALLEIITAKTEDETAEKQRFAEAQILLADIIGDILLSSRLPQSRKDEYFSKYEAAKRMLKECKDHHTTTPVPTATTADTDGEDHLA